MKESIHDLAKRMLRGEFQPDELKLKLEISAARILHLEKLLEEAILHLDPSNCTNREDTCEAMEDNAKLIERIKASVR